MNNSINKFFYIFQNGKLPGPQLIRLRNERGAGHAVMLKLSKDPKIEFLNGIAYAGLLPPLLIAVFNHTSFVIVAHYIHV
jgi:hypothetical protein